MPRLQILQLSITGERWELITEWDEPTPPGLTLYHEAFFCTHCGRVWAKRQWLVGARLSWWLNLRQCNLTPYDYYDLDHWTKFPSQAQEKLADDFLTDPSAFGYTFGGPPTRDCSAHS